MVEDFMPSRRSLRVAVVTETYPPEINGVAATSSRVVDGLRARGHEIQLVRPRQAAGESGADTERFSEVLMRGLPIPRYPQLRMGLPARRALVSLWAHRRPDVVHIVTEGPLGWSALHAALHFKLPVVSDFRTNFHAYSRHYGVGWLRSPVMAYLRKFHNRTACTMVPTDDLRRELAQSGFKGLRVVARGVDTGLFDPARRSEALRSQWGADAQTPVVICVGRLAPEKNLAVLVAAYEAMCRQQPATRLVLVGDGPERSALQQRCPNAIFAGIRTGEDLATHYASADMFLFPSTTETFGNVVPEAMASGLAVLGYDYAAAGQLLRDGNNGVLARFDDAQAFCQAALQLASDPIAARVMGLQARVTACRLDWGRIVAAVETEYLHAMAGADHRGATQSEGALAFASRPSSDLASVRTAAMRAASQPSANHAAGSDSTSPW